MLSLGIVIFIILTAQLHTLREDYNTLQYCNQSDPKRALFDVFEKQFGNDDSSTIIIHSEKGVFNRKTLKALFALDHDLRQINNSFDLKSLTTATITESSENDIEILPLLNLEKIDQMTDQEIEDLKNKALNAPNIGSYLLSKDGTLALSRIFLKPFLNHDGNALYNFGVETEKLIEAHRKNFTEAELHITGPAYLSKTTIDIGRQDRDRLAPFIFLFFALISYITLRSARGVSVVLLMIGLNVVIVLGVQSLLDIPLNSFTSIIPIIITTITTGAVVHIVSGFVVYYKRTGDSLAALTHTYELNLIPTFLTMFTTTAGFLALTDKTLMPVYQLSIVVGIGNFIAWILIMLIIGPILRLLHKQKTPVVIDEIYKIPVHSLPEMKSATLRAKSYANFLNKHKKFIVYLWLVIAILLGSLIFKLKISMNPFHQFSDKIPAVAAKNLVKEKLHFAMGLDAIVDTRETDGGKKIDLLKKIHSLETRLKNENLIVYSSSLNIILSTVHKTFNHIKDPGPVLPTSNEQVSQYLLLYSFSDTNELKQFITPDGRFLRLSFYIPEEDSYLILDRIDLIEKYAEEIGLPLSITGKLPLYMGMSKYIFTSMSQSALIALLIIGFFMYLLVGNFILTVLALIPNVLPIIIGGGVLYLAGSHVDVGIAFVFSVCLGIAVDDTIHILHHWKEQRSLGFSKIDVIEHLGTNLFPVIISTNLVLAAGFGILGLADFIPNAKFGILSAITLFIALFADLFLLPALILLDKKRL
jgi:predicted RND superfamily exporter protein